MHDLEATLAEFIRASVWHGPIDRSTAILAAHPDLAEAGIHAAAILGDEAAVRRFLAADPANATAKFAPLGWDALTHLCFSRFLRLDPSRSDALVRTATALLDAGASAKTGFIESDHQPSPEFESALYGAAGVAHHAGVTRLLLERGADPNDGEVAYHAPETAENEALRLIVGTGRVTAGNLSTMLLRKADWHDLDGVRWLLEHGADPNHVTVWKKTALDQAIQRDNSLEIVAALLEYGGDPTAVAAGTGVSAVELAARRGRGDALDLFARHGFSVQLAGTDRLLAACARNDGESAISLARSEPSVVAGLIAQGGEYLAQFAGNGNTGGVALLLDLGIPATAVYETGDGYFGTAKRSMALHVAAWRGRHATVRLLLDRVAPVDARDGDGRTPLALAVRACVDSHWTHRRTPESVQALLAAGASTSGVPFPSGYAEVDRLLEASCPPERSRPPS